MSNDNQHDDIVSRAYQDLATERTPEHLDSKVLAMAASAARQPVYSRWMSWSRPIAWAATVTLCLAISFELLQEPSAPPSAVPASPAPAVDPQTEARDAPARPDAAKLDEDKAHDDQPARDLARIGEPAKDEADEHWSLAEPEPQQELAESKTNTPAHEKAGLVRSASRQSSNARIASEATLGLADANSPGCSEERRATAESWQQCILELQEAGDESAAQRERDALTETFPDFKLP
jgi:hypothetical protein